MKRFAVLLTSASLVLLALAPAALAHDGGELTAGDDVTLRLVPERWQEWDLEPYFGSKLSDPRLVKPLAP